MVTIIVPLFVAIVSSVTCAVIPVELQASESGLFYQHLQPQASEGISRDVQGDPNDMEHVYTDTNGNKFGDRIYSTEQQKLGDAEKKDEDDNEEKSNERISNQESEDRGNEAEDVDEEKGDIRDSNDGYDEKYNEEVKAEEEEDDGKSSKEFEEFKWPSEKEWYEKFERDKNFDDFAFDSGYGGYGKFQNFRQYGGDGRFGCLELGHGEYC